MREVWAATVHGLSGQYERAVLEVDGDGRFVWSTSNATRGSTDVAVIEHADVVRLAEVLEDELTGGPGS